VAACLAGVLLVVCMQMIAAAGRQERFQDRRRAAFREAANVMERLAAVPLAELTPDRLDAVQQGAQLDERLPGARVEIAATPLQGPPAGKRLEVNVYWGEPSPEAADPVTLVAWRYR